MLQKTFFTFLIFIINLQVGFGQIPVNWQLQKKYLDENEFLLEFTVAIDSGWHMYASHDKKYPRPLIFNTLIPDNVTLRGDLVASTPFYASRTNYRGTWVNVPFYRDTVRFRQRIRVENLQEHPYVAGQVTYEGYRNGNNRSQIGYLCYQIDLRRKDSKAVELNKCDHSFDFCIPKRRQIAYYPLKVVPPQNSDQFVEWNYFYKKQSENTYKIIAEAKLEEGYRLMVDTTGEEAFKLKMDLIESKNISSVSPFIYASTPKSAYYSIWKQTMNYQEGTVRLERTVTLVDPLSASFLVMNLHYMICNDFDCYSSQSESIQFLLQKSQRRVIYVNQERVQVKMTKTDKVAESVDNE